MSMSNVALLLFSHEVAQMLGVSFVTVDSLCQSGEAPMSASRQSSAVALADVQTFLKTIEPLMPEFLKYREVKRVSVGKAIFLSGCHHKGALKRVHVNPGRNGLRITRKSVDALLATRIEEKDAQEFFGISDGRMAAMRQAKAREVSLPYQDTPATVISHAEPVMPAKVDNRSFAEKCLAGDATDSFGNDVHGSNRLCPETGVQTLVKPSMVDQGPPQDTQSHMNSVNLPYPVEDAEWKQGTPKAPEGFTSSGKPLAPGLTQAAYDQMINDWHRSGGRRSESEMEARSRVDRMNIHRSFPR